MYVSRPTSKRSGGRSISGRQKKRWVVMVKIRWGAVVQKEKALKSSDCEVGLQLHRRRVTSIQSLLAWSVSIESRVAFLGVFSGRDGGWNRQSSLVHAPSLVFRPREPPYPQSGPRDCYPAPVRRPLVSWRRVPRRHRLIQPDTCLARDVSGFC